MKLLSLYREYMAEGRPPLIFPATAIFLASLGNMNRLRYNCINIYVSITTAYFLKLELGQLFKLLCEKKKCFLAKIHQTKTQAWRLQNKKKKKKNKNKNKTLVRYLFCGSVL